jgi:hypothetical protein
MSLQKLISLVALAGLAFGLAACDEHEQGRILHHEKGVYLGKEDTPLSDADRKELRDRVRMQSG